MTAFLWIYVVLAVFVAILHFGIAIQLKITGDKKTFKNYIAWFILSLVYGAVWPGAIVWNAAKWFRLVDKDNE